MFTADTFATRKPPLPELSFGFLFAVNLTRTLHPLPIILLRFSVKKMAEGDAKASPSYPPPSVSIMVNHPSSVLPDHQEVPLPVAHLHYQRGLEHSLHAMAC